MDFFAKIVIGPYDIVIDSTESFFLLSRLNAKWSRKSCLTTTSFVCVMFFSSTFYRHFCKVARLCVLVFFVSLQLLRRLRSRSQPPCLCIQAIGIQKKWSAISHHQPPHCWYMKKTNMPILSSWWKLGENIFLFYHFAFFFVTHLPWHDLISNLPSLCATPPSFFSSSSSSSSPRHR